MKKTEKDRHTRRRFTCSAAVFSLFSEELGLDPDAARKVASGFCDGIAETGDICGAVSGAIMVIGYKFGNDPEKDDAENEKTQLLVRQLIREFTQKNGSINCTELLGHDLGDPEDYARAKDCGLFKECPALIRDATDILKRIL